MPRWLITLAVVLAVGSAGALLGYPIISAYRDAAEGVPLGEVSRAGPAPVRIALSSPDEVVIANGGAFALTADGDPQAVAALRFKLDRNTLSIGRTRHASASGRAVVHLTMPPPSKFALSSSGTIASDRAAGDVEVAISDSATLLTKRVEATRMRVAISGNGRYSAAGHADRLELAASGTSTTAMAGLTVGRAKVSLGGSANGAFSATGTVMGEVDGAAQLAIGGVAQCQVERTGGATLSCPNRALVGRRRP